MCLFKIIFSLLLCEIILAASIDQRQTGDLNVQIDLKNFKIFALTKGKEEYVDYDYAYDYSEMTIKPQNGTTSTTIKPLNTTEALVNTTVAPEIKSTTQDERNASISTLQMITTDSMVGISSSTTVAPTIYETANNTNATENENATRVLDCKKGFFRNSKGNCELKLQHPSNILRKMIQQKSKSSEGNGVRKS